MVLNHIKRAGQWLQIAIAVQTASAAALSGVIALGTLQLAGPQWRIMFLAALVVLLLESAFTLYVLLQLPRTQGLPSPTRLIRILRAMDLNLLTILSNDRIDPATKRKEAVTKLFEACLAAVPDAASKQVQLICYEKTAADGFVIVHASPNHTPAMDDDARRLKLHDSLAGKAIRDTRDDPECYYEDTRRLHDDPDWVDSGRSPAPVCMIGFPIRVGRSRYGVVTADRPTADAIHGADREIIKMFALGVSLTYAHIPGKLPPPLVLG